MGSCPGVNISTHANIIQFNQTKTLIQYLQVLTRFLLVIPPWQNANAPIISQNNMTKYFPLFKNDFQNAYPTINEAVPSALPNSGANVANADTSKNTPKNKKLGKTLFLSKYFKNKDSFLNLYATMQEDISKSIALLLQVLRKRNESRKN